MSKGSSHRGRQARPAPKHRQTTASKSLAELKERLGRIADEAAALILGLDDGSPAEAAVNNAVNAMWVAESRIDAAVAALAS